MEPLGDALKKRMDNFHQNQALTATAIVESANRVLPANYRAKSLRGSILTVEAATGVLAYQLKQDKDTYIERINAALATPFITDLRIRITYQK